MVASTSPSSPTEPLNHFEESHPKDDLEIRKAKDEIIHSNKKDHKKGTGKQNNNTKKENTPKSSPVANVTPVVDVEQPPVVANEVVAVAAVAVVQKESPKNVANKDKYNKKKKNEAILVQKLGKYPY